MLHEKDDTGVAKSARELYGVKDFTVDSMYSNRIQQSTVIPLHSIVHKLIHMGESSTEGLDLFVPLYAQCL